MSESAARPAAAVTLGYLLVTLPLFWRGAWDAGHAAFLTAHVGAAIALSWAVVRSSRFPVPSSQRASLSELGTGNRELFRELPRLPRDPATLLADWLPLLLVPLLYAELPYLMGDPVYRDPMVRAWEAALFGMQPARTLAGAAPNVLLSELLHLGYVLYYPIVYVPPLVAYVRGRTAAFGDAMLAVMLTYALCYLVFVMFPVEGPRYAWGAPAGVPSGPTRSLTLAILEGGSSRGTAFPSSHAAVAVAQAVVALRHQRGLGVAVAVTSVFLMIGAVYGGFHYAVDMVAGAVLGAGVAVAVAFGLRRSDRRDRFTTHAR